MRLVLFFTLMLLQVTAHASSNNEQFLSFVRNRGIANSISLQAQVAYDYDENRFEVDESLFEQLLSIAQSQSEIWGDTILEGDVWTLGEIRVDRIEYLFDGDELLGYRITYSQKGWETAFCDLTGATVEDYNREETFAQCAEGRVYESAYATADLRAYFIDYNAVATLVLND